MGEPLYAAIVAVTLALLTTGQIVLQLLLNAKLTMKQAETDQIERLIRAESDAQSALRRDEVGIIDAESRAASRATIDAARASAIANGYLAPPDTHFDPPALTH